MGSERGQEMKSPQNLNLRSHVNSLLRAAIKLQEDFNTLTC